MRKIYSLAVMLVLALVSMTAAAETYKFRAAYPEHLKSYQVNDDSEEAWGDENTIEVELEAENGEYVTVNAADGYMITDAKYKGKSILFGQENMTSVSIFLLVDTEEGTFQVDDPGIPIEIFTSEFAVAKNLTLKFNDSSMVGSLSFREQDVETSSNEVEVSTIKTEGYISAKTGYEITAITCNGNNIATVSLPSTSAPFSLENVEDGDAIEFTLQERQIPTYIFQIEGDLEGYSSGMDSNWVNSTSASSFTDNKYTLQTEASSYKIYAETGYVFKSVKVDGTDVVTGLPSSSADIPLSSIASGSTIVIEIGEKEKVIHTFKGANGLTFKHSDGTTEVADSDEFQISPNGDYDYIEISSTDPALAITSIVDEKGNSLTNYSGKFNLSPYSYQASTTFTVTTRAVELKYFTIIVDEAANVSVYNNSSPVKLETGTNKMSFDPEDASGKVFRISGNGKTLREIKVNGVAVEIQYNSYEYTANEGDQVEIVTLFPDVDVPFSFNFVNEGTEGALSSVSVDGKNVSNWNEEGFTIKLGSTVNLEFNTNGYELETVTLNGESFTVNYGRASLTVTEETAYNFEITATKVKGFDITITTDQWEHLSVYRKSDYTDPVEITGSPFTFEVDKYSTIYLVAKDGYYIKSKSNNEYLTPTFETSETYIYENKSFSLVLEELVRDHKAIVYVDEAADGKASFSVTHKDYYGLSVSYSKDGGNLKAGYNEVVFGDDDTFGFNFDYAVGATDRVVYVNGEVFEHDSYGYYEYYKNPEANSVVKLFVSEPESYTVTYKVSEDAAPAVTHDVVTAIDFTEESYTVLQNTQITIAASDVKYDVEVNGKAVEAAEDGSYTIIVTEDSEISVEVHVDPVAAVNFVFANEGTEGALKSVTVDGEAADYTAENFTVAVGSKVALELNEAYKVTVKVNGEALEGTEFTVESTEAYEVEITANLIEVVRDQNLTVFVESQAVSAVELTLADADMPELSAAQTVKAGYNTLKFAENDELAIAAKADVEVYVDGVKVDASEKIGDLTETTVVKIFTETPKSWTMDYDFGEGVEVEVYHDHVTLIESPATHSVFHGTHVAIKPVASASPAAKAEAAKLEVKINGTALTPNAEGYYEFTAEQDVKVAVAKVTSGLEGIVVDGEDADIYNLQGVKVGNTSTTKALPSGIYIINGQKIRL